MKKYFLLFLTIFTFYSCRNNDENEIYIPREKFISILADIHLADAYYGTHYGLNKNHNDSVNFYNSILKNYGYTRVQFDTTLKFYTIHSQKFDLLYEDVVTSLSKTEQETSLLRPVDIESAKNIWRGKNAWYLPEEGGKKKIPVSLKLNGKGKYIVTFTCKMFPDDQSRNPRVDLYFTTDSSSRPKKDTLKSVLYKKDARTALITITKELKDSTFTYLKGFLLDHNDKSGDWKKHVIIEGLKIYYFPLK